MALAAAGNYLAIRSAVGIHRRVAEEHQTWWVHRTTCPEGEAGVVKIHDMPYGQLRCIGCEAVWIKETLAEDDGTLRIVTAGRQFNRACSLTVSGRLALRLAPTIAS